MIGWIIVAIGISAALMLWRSNVKTSLNRPRVGEPAPAFTLPDQQGRSRSPEEYRGRWLVLYFYPRDDTPGCAEQAGRYRDAMLELEAHGAAVCGVSVDSSDSHADFARKYRLGFPLLADRKGDVARIYGSLRDFGLIRFATRNTFLIDPEGTIAKVYVGVSAARDTQDVIGDLKLRVPAAA